MLNKGLTFKYGAQTRRLYCEAAFVLVSQQVALADCALSALLYAPLYHAPLYRRQIIR